LKALLYGLLTLLLALVAGTITNIDTFSHALHASMTSATSQVGLDLKLLTTLRAIAKRCAWSKAVLLGVCRQTVYCYIYREGLPSISVRGIRPELLKSWLEEREQRLA